MTWRSQIADLRVVRHQTPECPQEFLHDKPMLLRETPARPIDAPGSTGSKVDPGNPFPWPWSLAGLDRPDRVEPARRMV
jgi:hypothetical protein